MKKRILLVLLVAVTLLSGCMTVEKDNEEAYQFIVENIDDSDAIKTYLEKEKSRGGDIDVSIMSGDSILMIAARYTTNIEVLETIATYFPSIHKMNYQTDMSAIDYLTRREGTEDMVKFLVEESVKQEVLKKANETKNSVVKSIFKKF